MSETKKRVCPVCGDDQYNSFDHNPYIECTTCRTRYQPSFIPKMYEGSHEKSGDLMSELDKAVNKNLADWLYAWIKGKPQKSVLDVGAKYPYLMHCIQTIGVGIKVLAVDGIDEVIKFGEELGVFTQRVDVEACHQDFFKENSQDLITLVHVLEHFYEPIITLKKLATMIKPGGYIFVRCPLYDVSGSERHLTSDCFEIHPQFYCAESVKRLADSAGLRIVHSSMMPGAGQGDFMLQKPAIAFAKGGTIGVGMIVKNEERDLPICLASIAPIKPKSVVIVDTGSTDRTKEVVKEFCRKHDWSFSEGNLSVDEKIYETNVRWKDYTDASEKDDKGNWQLWDFSKARNVYVDCLDQIVDWILWMDADDKLEKPELVRALTHCNDDAFNFSIVDSFDKPQSKFSHMRFWRTKLGVKYDGACHEYPRRPSTNSLVDSGFRILHSWDHATTQEPSTNRNLRILKREYEQGRVTSRTLFYLANSYRDCMHYAEAIKIYTEYLDKHQAWPDERVFAHMYRARCYRFMGKHREAISAAYKGLAEHDGFSELWMELCYSYFELKDPRCLSSAVTAADNKPPRTSLFQEINKYTDQPYRMMSFWWERAGEKQAALAAAEKVLTFVPEDVDWKARIAKLKESDSSSLERGDYEISVKYKVDEAIFVRPGAIGDILCCLMVVQKYKEMCPEKRIVFYTHSSNMQLVKACPIVDEVREFKGVIPPGAINFIGYPRHEGYPHKPMKKHLVEYFADEAGLCAIKIATGDLKLNLPNYKAPKQPYVTIQAKAGWSPYKEWPLENWQKIIDRIVEYNVKVVHVGGPSDQVFGNVDWDLRGRTTILEAISLIKGSLFHLGVDSFGNHATALHPFTKGVIVWGSTSPTGSGYDHNSNLYLDLKCSPCYREYPTMSVDPLRSCPHKIGGDSWDNIGVPCTSGISVSTVWQEVKKLLD